MWQTKESHLETRFGAGDHGPLFKRSAAKTRHVRSLAVLWAEDLVGAQCTQVPRMQTEVRGSRNA